MTRVRSFLSALALLVVAACGSGGGGTTVVESSSGLPDPNSLFRGDYGYAWIQGLQGVPDTVSSLYGTLTADGAQNTLITYTINAEGIIAMLPPEDEFVSQVEQDRVLELGSFLPDVSIWRGAISDTGDVVCLASALTGYGTNAVVACRHDPGHSNASLNGTYWFIGHAGMAGLGVNYSSWGSITFDGAGAATMTIHGNVEGAIAGPNVEAVTYSVGPNGAFTLNLPGGNVVQGAVGAGGELATAGGGIAAGDDPTFFLCVRQGAGYVDEDLHGAWHMVGFLHEFLPNDYTTFTGAARRSTMTTNFTLFGTLMRNADAEVQPPQNQDLTIDAMGNVTLEVTPGVSFRGGMSSDRRFIVLAGLDQPGLDPGWIFLMR